MTRPAHRWAALPLLAVFLLLGAGRGYCPMAGAGTGQEGDPHSCCGTGLRSTAPSCCHAATAPGAAALSKVVVSPAVPAAAGAYDLAGDTPLSGHPSTAGVLPHRPLAPVLRI